MGVMMITFHYTPWKPTYPLQNGWFWETISFPFGVFFGQKNLPKKKLARISPPKKREQRLKGFDFDHCSHEPRKKPSYFPLDWLVNRDPYNGLL